MKYAVALLILASFGCSEELTQEDTPPRITGVGPLEAADDRTVLVPYSITDLEGDDATLEVLVCQGNSCAPAVQGVGGDGVARVPTIPATPDEGSASHVFAWDVACATIDASTGDFVPVAVDSPFTIAFRVIGSDADPVSSPESTLQSLGFDSGDGSGIVIACDKE